VEKALKAGLFARGIAAPKIHGLRQLLARCPTTGSPDVDLDDLDLLDPWVIDGRYAADLPDLSVADAQRLLVSAERVVDTIRLFTATSSDHPGGR
jgi:HEPN domain-containing protein